MTFQDFAHEHLFNNGMFENDVQKVIEAAKEDDVLKDTMAGRWHDNMDDYPISMQSVFVVSLNNVVTKYIDENMPKAWFRPIFAGKVTTS
jgi:hypothetical protein